MPRPLHHLFCVSLVALLVGGPLWYASYRDRHQRNFRVVREGVLYRSGQLTLDGLRRVVHDHGIKTVISLRDSEDPRKPAPDAEEEAWCRRQELDYYRIPPRRWWSNDGPAPVEEGVRTFLQVMGDPKKYPVLVHCFAGIHRTGAYCAIYRMEHDGWSNEKAIAEMKACGYDNLDEEMDILGFLEAYQPGRRAAHRHASEE